MYHNFCHFLYLMGRNKSESLVIPVTSFQCEPCLVSPSDRCSFGRVCVVDVNFCPRYLNQSNQPQTDASSRFMPFCEFHYSEIKGSLSWANITLPLLSAAVIYRKLAAASLQLILSFSKLSALLKNNVTGFLCGSWTPPRLHRSGSLCLELLNFGRLDLVSFVKKTASKIALQGDARGCFFSRVFTGGLVIPPFCPIIGIFPVSFGLVL